MRALHVDDDAGVRSAVARVLQRAGFSVVSAVDGAAGLEAARRRRPDVVVLDVDLPDLSGFEVCQRLRADPRTRRVPVVHLSAARTSVENRVEGLDSGADAYLVHPVVPTELVATVRAVLRTRREEDRARRAARRAAKAPDVREETLAVATQALLGPLAALEINATGLQSTLPAGDAVARARAAALLEASRAASKVLSDLLEIARVEARGVTCACEPRETADVLAQAVERARAAADDRGVAVHCEAPSGVRIRCDAALLAGSLAQLVREAVRATPSGGAVAVRAEIAGGDALLTIEDGAPPPRDDDRTRLHESVWEAAPSRGHRGRFGVALARAVVEAHGGRIWFGLSPTGAARLHATLPAEAAPAEPPDPA